MTLLNPKQITWLLQGIDRYRIGTDGKGFSHVEAWDIRRHLIRVFGFGGFDTKLEAADLISEIETGGRWNVVYRCAITLTVKTPNPEPPGTWHTSWVTLGSWHGIATGDGQKQKTLADAHDLALKKADSQALKRAAINLGDQFGLSLYNGGSADPVVKSSLAYQPDATPDPATEAPVRPDPQQQAPADSTPTPSTAPRQDQADERAQSRAEMWDAADLVGFTEGLPNQFLHVFGHPLSEGTATEYREARRLMLDTQNGAGE